VVLAHALGLGADSFRVGQTASLVNQLTQAGFAVYLLTHRGDRDALPRQGRHSFDVDTILEQDIPSALDRILGHSGAKQVHWVGHGFGGILGLAWLARMGAEAQIASFVSLSAPVLFETPRSEGRLSSLALAMMPSRWRLPTRTLAKWMSPWLDGEQNLFGVTLPGVTDGPRLRSACTYSVEDIPLGLLRQISHWLREGTLTDRSGSLHYAEALCKIDIPLLVIASPADELCPVHAAKVVRDCWGGDDTRCLELNEDYGHMDVILGRDAPQDVFRPIVEWLEGHRSACWLNGRTVEAERLAVEG